MVQGSWISEQILRRQNHLCVPDSSTPSGEVCPARALPGSIPPAQEKMMTPRPVKSSSTGISHFIWLWTRLGSASWLSEPDTAFLLTFSCLLSSDKQEESLIHEDNQSHCSERVSDQNSNQFYSGKQNLVHTEFQTVSTFLKGLLTRWGYGAHVYITVGTGTSLWHRHICNPERHSTLILLLYFTNKRDRSTLHLKS